MTQVIQGFPRPDLTATDFADITTAVCTISLHPNGFDAILDFDAELTLEQIEAISERSRTPSNEKTLRDRAISALVNNRNQQQVNLNYLETADTALAADVRAQVKRLTQQNNSLMQQNNGIIRLLLGLLDGTD